MQFRKITANKYIGQNGYYLHRGKDGCFSIFKGTAGTKWGTGFQTVRAAEIFLSNHDYIHATTNIIPISSDDLEFIIVAYALDTDKNNPNILYRDEFDLMIPNHFDTSGEVLVEYEDETGNSIQKWFDNPDSLLTKLDELTNNDIFASVICRGTEFRDIIAKRENRSARDITKNLIRVKSSNVWAYGIEIKDNKAKVGDVYVQFKGKNGGPGDVYKLYDVPVQLWRRFVAAPSKGHFYWRYLRNDFYYSKLTGDKKGKLPNAINN